MSYVASSHPTAQDRSKISFIQPIPQFEWVIGTGAYLFEENNALLEQEQMLKSKMQSTIINMLAVSLIIMLLVMGIMFYLDKTTLCFITL